jgi:hypothetical protein
MNAFNGNARASQWTLGQFVKKSTEEARVIPQNGLERALDTMWKDSAKAVDEEWVGAEDLAAAVPPDNVNSTLARSTASELLDRLEDLRREKPSIEMSPLNAELTELLANQFGLLPGDCDYSSFGNIIDRAKAALDESLPLGQYARSSIAVYLLVVAANGLRLWMDLKGFNSNLISLDRTTSLEFQQDKVQGTDALSPGGGPITMDRSIFAPNGKLIPAVSVKVTDIEKLPDPELGNYTKLVTVTRSMEWMAGLEGINVMRVQRSQYLLGDADPAYAFSCPPIGNQAITVIDQRLEPEVVVEKPLDPFKELSSGEAIEATQFVAKWDDENWFVEPGTGLLMSKTLWYITSDSGSYYTSQGFPTSEAAEKWFVNSEWHPDGEAHLTTYNSVNHQFGDMEAANIVYGGNFYDFWRFNDLSMLMTAMEMYEQGQKEKALNDAKAERLVAFKSGVELLLALALEDEAGKRITVQDILVATQAALAQAPNVKQEGGQG